MSNIDKQALREAANAANAASWGYWESYKPHKGARGYEVKVGVKAVAQHCLKVDSVFIAAANPATVLALLDELEAKDSMIAAQQHEICTLLNALEGRPCPKCNDTGMADSGGTQPWGEPISVPCDCAAPPAPVSVPDEIPKLKDGRGFKYVKDRVRYSVNYANGWNACRAAMLQGAENAESRCSNSPVIPDQVLSAVRKVARIRADFDDFDGDRRGIGDCLDEAEQELIVTINKYASVIAAAPQHEVKP